ncbi:hypothetical protein GCM10010195_58370 [Kitasatospora griseola]|nr:hypothetical protein GCM10010195_58370 [Kitasatospora griseola]
MGNSHEAVIRDIRGFAASGHGPVDVVRRMLSGLTDPRGGMPSSYTCATCLYRAFEIEIEVAKRAQAWAGFGRGGSMTNEQLERLLGRLVPRSEELFD